MAVEERRFRVDEPDPLALSPLRQWASETLASWPSAGTRVDDVRLVVSELATNALRHARTAFDVALVLDGASVRVEVHDRDSRLPVLVGADADATSGRGLQIVAMLADDWGSCTEELDGLRGKVVWATLDLGDG